MGFNHFTKVYSMIIWLSLHFAQENERCETSADEQGSKCATREIPQVDDRAQKLQTKGGQSLTFPTQHQNGKSIQLQGGKKHTWYTRICQKHEIWLAGIAQACNHSFTQECWHAWIVGDFFFLPLFWKILKCWDVWLCWHEMPPNTVSVVVLLGWNNSPVWDLTRSLPT